MGIRKRQDKNGSPVDHYWTLVDGKIDRKQGVRILDAFYVQAQHDLDRLRGKGSTLKRASGYGIVYDRFLLSPFRPLLLWWGALDTNQRINIIGITAASILSMAALWVSLKCGSC